jgi:hypothetical protein
MLCIMLCGKLCCVGGLPPVDIRVRAVAAQHNHARAEESAAQTTPLGPMGTAPNVTNRTLAEPYFPGHAVLRPAPPARLDKRIASVGVN